MSSFSGKMKKSAKKSKKSKKRSRSSTDNGEAFTDVSEKVEKKNKSVVEDAKGAAKRGRAEAGDTSRGQKSRAIKQFRKTMKPDFELVEEAKRLYEIVKPKDAANIPGDKHDLIDSMIELTKGRVAKLVMKHDASRIIQMCMKQGNQAQRERIIEELMESITDLVSSKYGKFLATKLFKYGSKDQRNRLLHSFRGQARRMCKQKGSMIVLEHAYSEYMNAAQKRVLLAEIYAPETALLPDSVPDSLHDLIAERPAKRDRVMQDLSKLTSMWVNKEMLGHSLVHRVILEYLKELPQDEFKLNAEQYRELIPHFCHTKEGAALGVYLVSEGVAKDRKLICRSVKPYICKMAQEEYGHLVLLRLLDVTDDTRLLKDTILTPLLSDETCFADKWAALLLLHVLSPRNPSYFSQYVREELLVPSATSKKPAEKRTEELRKVVGPALPALISGVLKKMQVEESNPLNIKRGLQLIVEACTNEHLSCGPEIADALASFLATGRIEAMSLFHLSRCAKSLIKSGFGMNFWSRLSPLGEDFLLESLKAKGAGFIVLALAEADTTSSKVVPILKKHKNSIVGINQPAAKLVAKLL